jgi:hypothetical protein
MSKFVLKALRSFYRALGIEIPRESHALLRESNDDAQAQYNCSPELRELLSRAANSPTTKRPRPV